jgi:hypothetical protein
VTSVNINTLLADVCRQKVSEMLTELTMAIAACVRECGAAGGVAQLRV